MPEFNPENVRSLVSKVMRASPSDVRLIAQRLHDHAIEERMSPEAAKAFVVELGYGSLEAFCADIGLPAHIAERWARFGVSGEMRQVFTLLAEQRRKMGEAIAEFEAITHVGIEDFLRERELL